MTIDSNKVEKDVYNNQYQDTMHRIRIIDFSCRSIANYQASTDEFIDNILPVKVYFQISDTIHKLYKTDNQFRCKLIDIDRN